ncbi:hypothetical protein [Haloquadratum walsbyi]|jgi:hypothetical protein|nr:hypothetical protein [Haloquadratum walsbyi]
MNSATRGQFRALEQPYIQDIEIELDTLDAQVNSGSRVVDWSTLRKVARFTHQTRQNGSEMLLRHESMRLECASAPRRGVRPSNQ